MGGENDDVTDISDPTEWLRTPLSSLAPVDSALRCQVCKDFYSTPMITSCSHTFCSICIRRCLAADGKCPACRNSEQEVKLRRDWALDDVVTAFQSARASTLLYARASREAPLESLRRPTKRKLDDMDLIGSAAESSQGRKTRSQSRREAGRDGADCANNVIDITEDSSQEQDDGLVACPMCSRRMKEEQVYLHLDRCEEERKTGDTLGSETFQSPLPSTSSLSQRPKIETPLQNLERLPKLNYSLYKEYALRKKLNELGIRALGPKSILERRHTEWVNLWNANCDSLRPRSKREVLQDLDLWERTQGTLAPAPLGPGNSVMRKDFDGVAWATTHGSEFQQLIADARRRKGGATPSEGGTLGAHGSAVTPPITSSSSEDQTGNMAATDENKPAMLPELPEATAIPPDIGQPEVAAQHVPGDSDNYRPAIDTLDDKDSIVDGTSVGDIVESNNHHPPPHPSVSTPFVSPSKQTRTSPISSKFFSSPRKARMVDDIEDPVMDAGRSVPVD